ncbi:MAG: hypothetical protein WDO74_25695 [Pseudomonadota bacterium]
MLAYARESAEFYLNYLAESGLEIPAPVAHVSVPRDQEVGLVGVFKSPRRDTQSDPQVISLKNVAARHGVLAALDEPA